MRGLLAAGVLLVLLGAGMLGYVAFSRPAADRTANTPPVGEARGVQAAPPSPFWSVAAGLTLAVGAGCLGIGMNRWKR